MTEEQLTQAMDKIYKDMLDNGVTKYKVLEAVSLGMLYKEQQIKDKLFKSEQNLPDPITCVRNIVHCWQDLLLCP